MISKHLPRKQLLQRLSMHQFHPSCPTALGLCFIAALPSLAPAQIVNPADQQAQAPPPASQTEVPEKRLRSWELPPTLVEAPRLSALREEDRVGTYGQPRWTASRRFPTTRIYVIPEGKFEFEYWGRVEKPRDGPATHETQYEVEIGLPHRFQLDLYYAIEKTGSLGALDTSAQKIELRYALADWGKLWGNPTLYGEYAQVSNGSDVFESKLLLGDEFTSGWHWGTNLVWERELTADLGNTFEWTGGVSRTLQDEKLSLGIEYKVEFKNDHADRNTFDQGLEVGPSLQWRPLPALHFDIYFVLGWEF